MSTVYKVVSTAFAVVDSYEVTSNVHSGSVVSVGHQGPIDWPGSPNYRPGSDKILLLKFQDAPAPGQFKKLDYFRVYLFGHGGQNSAGEYVQSDPYIHFNDGAWEPSSVTYERIPDYSGYIGSSDPKFFASDVWHCSSGGLSELRYFLKNHGLRVEGSVPVISVYTPSSNYAPYVEYSMSDDNIYLEFGRFSPSNNAKINRFNACTVSFKLKQVGTALESLGIVSYTIQWTGGEKISVPVAGLPLSASYSIPANTLPSGDVTITVTVTDNAGGTASYSVKVNTEDTVSSARTVSPVDTYLDGSAPITFRWNHVNSSGSQQTKALLQVWPDGGSVVTEAEITGTVNEYTVPPNTYTSGDYYWRVATFNADGVQGSWATAKFLVIAAPAQPIVLVQDASPRPSILWQTNEQEAYQIQLSGIYDQILFGVDQNWRCPVYLEDGTYTIRVRSQNKYGLWSAWGEAPIIVANQPGPEINLRVQFGHTAKLSWALVGYDHYQVYRDGVPIARTADAEYTDLYSCGLVTYLVRGCYADRYDYGLSNTVTGQICINTTMIKQVNGGDWIMLPTSTQLHNGVKKTLARDVQRLLVQGRPYPITEASEYYNKQISLDCAFAHRDDPGLEQLLGKLVCLKTESQDMVIGTLDELQVSSNYFLVSYALTVSQEHFQEEIDLDTGIVLPG